MIKTAVLLFQVNGTEIKIVSQNLSKKAITIFVGYGDNM